MAAPLNKPILITVIIVLAIGLGVWIFLPQLKEAANSARQAYTRDTVRQLAAASAAYQKEYGELPPSDMRQLVATLTGKNPRSIVFVKFTETELNKEGYLVDPWRSPYLLIADPDGAYRFYSPGRNRQDDHGAPDSDDIVNWR